MGVVDIDIQISKKEFLPVYRPLLANDQVFDIDFLYGGRDSGKSRFIASVLIIACMELPYFRCLLTRKVGNTIKDSQWQTIKDVAEAWGVDHLFRFKVSPLEIICVNGNTFLCRGFDEPAKIKSLSNPSHCWVEEGNQIDNVDFVTLLTTLRYNGGNVKTYFSFNPECETSYTEFWLYQDWFAHAPAQLSWTWEKEVKVDANVLERYRGEKLPDSIRVKDDGSVVFIFSVRATHSTYKDNPYCSPQRIALYESYKNGINNQYWYQVYTLGRWGFKKTGGEFWKCFDEQKHTRDISAPAKTPYHVCIDNNVAPYVTLSIWQMRLEEKELQQFDELPCVSPDNTAAKAAKRLVRWLHQNGNEDPVFLYGDPSANARTTVDDEGRSFFDKFKAVLKEEGVLFIDRIGKRHPSVALSGAFINEIYESNFAGWSIVINKRCRTSIEDYSMVKEAADGTMLKVREKNKETKQSFERYGHFSDTKRYFITTVLKTEFSLFGSRRKRSGSIAA